MNTAILRNGYNYMNNTAYKPIASHIQAKPTASTTTKYWGIWLPVPTFLAIANSIFWTWLIMSTVGYIEQPLDKVAEKIIERF